MKASSNCEEYYHCVDGAVTSDLVPRPAGLIFNEDRQCYYHAYNIQCDFIPTPRGDPSCQENTYVAVDNCKGYACCGANGLDGITLRCQDRLLFDENRHNYEQAGNIICGGEVV